MVQQTYTTIEWIGDENGVLAVFKLSRINKHSIRWSIAAYTYLGVASFTCSGIRHSLLSTTMKDNDGDYYLLSTTKYLLINKYSVMHSLDSSRKG